MPVLVNNQSGRAEDLPEDQASQAITAGTHGIPLNDPNGNPVVAGSISDAQNLLQNGHVQPNEGQLKSLLDYGKYSSPGQKIATLAEHAAGSATFGASTGLERALGVPGEDITARSKYNPGFAGAGDVAGLIGSSIYGGEGAAITQMGKEAASRVGERLGEGVLSKVGQSATNMFVQGAMMQSGNEVTKMLASDPAQSGESAIADITMAGVFNGALGGAGRGVQQLWEKSKAPEAITGFLSGLKDKVNVTPQGVDIDEAANRAGMDISNGMRSAVSNVTPARAAFEGLTSQGDTGTKAASSALQERNAFYGSANAQIARVNKIDPESLTNFNPSASKFQAGEAARSAITEDIRSAYSPLAEVRHQAEAALSYAPITPEGQASFASAMEALRAPLAKSLGDDAPEVRSLDQIGRAIPTKENYSQWQNFTSQWMDKIVGDDPQSPNMPKLANEFQKAVQSFDSKFVTTTIGATHPELASQLQSYEPAYQALKSKMDQVGSLLGIRNDGSPDAFLAKLGDAKNMNAEKIIDRLTPQKNMEALTNLAQNFPRAGQIAKSYLQEDLLKSGMSPSGDFVTTKYLSALNRLEPEMRDYLYSPEDQATLSGVKDLVSAVPKGNGLEFLAAKGYLNKMAGGIAAVTGALLTHSGIGAPLGYLVLHAARYLGDETPDAVSYAALKFLGGHGNIDPSAFMTAVKYAGSVIRTDKLITAGVSSAINGKDPVRALLPNKKSDQRLDQAVQAYTKDPSQFMDSTGNLGYYMDDHAGHVSSTVVRAASYLNTVRPKTDPLGPLDSPRTPSSEEAATFNRSLSLVNKPLSILETVRQGNLTTQDLAVMESVYPALYSRMKNEMIKSVIEKKSKGEMIPYQKRLVMSRFLGQNLDSTIGPAPFLISPPHAPQQAGQPGSGGGGKASRSQTAKLGKLPGMENTMTQRAEQDRISPPK